MLYKMSIHLILQINPLTINLINFLKIVESPSSYSDSLAHCLLNLGLNHLQPRPLAKVS